MRTGRLCFNTGAAALLTFVLVPFLLRLAGVPSPLPYTTGPAGLAWGLGIPITGLSLVALSALLDDPE